MSKIDFQKHYKLARQLRLYPLKITAFTNTLMLKRKSDFTNDKLYIWIDPSWVIFYRGKKVISSADYPHHKEPLCKQKHDLWCKKKNKISNTILLSVKLNKNQHTVFRLSGGYEIVSYGYRHQILEGKSF